MTMATIQDDFFTSLQIVMGQVFEAAGYQVVDAPYQQQGGLISYRRLNSDNVVLSVSYQLLAHTDMASRFQIMLTRKSVDSIQTVTLSRLLWDTFNIKLLASPEHWWAFSGDGELADALLESGKLLAAYGLPWLDGSLRAGQATGG